MICVTTSRAEGKPTVTQRGVRVQSGKYAIRIFSKVNQTLKYVHFGALWQTEV